MNRKQRRAAAKFAGPSNNRAGPGAGGGVPAGVPGILAAGVEHHQAGRLFEAQTCYRRVLAVQPDNADALNLLGVLAQQSGRHDLAIELIGQAVKRDGQHPLYFSNLGLAFYSQGKYREAIAAYRRAIAIDPNYAEAHCNLGNACKELGELDEAVAAHRRATAIKPHFAEAHANLGNVLRDVGKLDEAIAAHRRATVIKPNFAQAHYNLGNALHEQGNFAEAISAFRLAIGLKGDYAEAHYNLGNALREQDKTEEAISAFRRAIAIKRDYADAYCNLGSALKDQGKLDEAVAAYRQAIGVSPGHTVAHSNLLFCLNNSDTVTADHLLAAHREWDDRHGQPAPRRVSYANRREVDRRLRIGYFSPDFRQHSVTHFFEPLLQGHDRQALEVFCYAEVRRPDAVTARLQGLADHWRSTVGLSDDALAERIRADRIDILVDLAGHTGGNRLPVFARKPAPIQVTWLGYPNTTGLKAIDYRLVDAVTDPVGEAEALASEALVRLDGGFLCYGGPKEAPEPGPPPCLKTGAVAFGSFNSPTKACAATFDAWATLLARLPQARLLLKGRQFADAAARATFLARLGERGVAGERVELVAWVPDFAAHLALYGRIDVALDPFPYNGTTTTCEALWMGVPVVTLKGDRHAGRVGASLLSQLGLTDLAAASVEEYVETAVALAGNPARLDELRRSLRPRMAASPLCDERAFARKIEVAFRKMWRRWCETPGDDPSGRASSKL